ncbi:MAG: hypothetical protein ABI948_09205 [Thermoleophilia bacterium]
MSGEQRRLVDDASRGNTTWLRDGRIAYTTVERSLVFVSLAGSRRPQAFRVPNPRGPDTLDLGYAVSPDGTRVAYVHDCGLWLRNLATGRSTRVLRGEFANVPDANSWSPDSSKFVAPNASWEKKCREFYRYPPSENRIFNRDGRRIGIAPGGGTTWSRDSRWLAVFDGEHGTNVGGMQPLDVVSFPDQHIASILRGGNTGPAFIGPGDRILYGVYAHPETFGPPLETGYGAHPELWLGRLWLGRLRLGG